MRYMRETEMGVVMNFVLVLRTIFSVIKTCCRAVRYHPPVLFVILFFYLLYRFVPSVFNLLLSSFPLFTCTVALIASLVALGHGSDKKTREETTNAASATETNEKAIGSIKLAGPLSRRQKSKQRVSFSAISFESSVRNTTTTDYRSKEIHEDGKLETDKPIGEISDYKRDASDSSQDPSLKQNQGIAESLSSGSVSNPSSSHAESSSSNASVVGINPVPTDAPSQPVLVSFNEFDGAPEESDRSNEDGFESEAEKNGTKSAAGDDEKNLMDLGESETERNQRLESLMARRRARKKMLRMVAGKNLTDVDHNDPPIHITPLAVIKNNPFDHPTENEIPGLPPIPGSAPSVLVPRANPFDLPYDPQEERPNLTGDSFHEEFMNVIQKDIFCRHESFCYGSTSYLGLKQYKSDNNIRSISVVEDLGSPEQRQMCARSDSTSSLGTEIELRSLVPYQEDQMKPVEEQSAQECELMPPIDQSANFVQGTTQSPEADVVEIHQEERNQAYIKPDIVEEKYIGMSSSSSSSSEFSRDEVQSPAIEPYRGDSKEEPVYDSSPSAIEKRTIEESLFCEDKGVVLTSVLSIASDMQVEVSEATSPSASSERQTAFTFTDEELVNYNENVRSRNSSVGEDLWAASPDLHTVDETKAKSNGVAEISDLDVINAGLFGTCTDANTGIPIEQQPVLNPVTSNPPSCPSETESKIEGVVTQASSSSTEPEADDARVPREDWKENVASSSSARQLPHGSWTVQPSRDGDHHNEEQALPISSTEEHHITDPLAIGSKTNPALINEPSKRGSMNQRPLSNAVKDTHSQVYDLNLETADTIASAPSVAQPSIENLTGQTSMDGNHLKEKQGVSFKSNEEENTINNVKDPLAVESYPISSLMCEPLNGHQNPLPSTEPEMHNHVEQLVTEENAEPTTEYMEEGDIIKDVNDSVSTDSKSTSSVDEQQLKEGVMNENSSSPVEAEIMNNQVHSLKLEENVDPEASSSSVALFASEKSVVHPSMDNDHHKGTKESFIISTEEGNIIKNYQHGMHPVTTDSGSTSSVTNEPIKEGLMNCDPSSDAEQEMHNQDRQVNLEENVEQTVSGSSLSQVPVGNTMVQPLVDSDHHEATQESSMQSPEEDNIINNVKDPIIVEEEKSKPVKDIEGDNQKLIERQADFPETALESGASSVDHHPIKDTHVAGTPGTEEQAFEANQNLETGTQRDADEEDKIQLTAGTLLESATASSADQFDDLGTNNLQKMMASRTIQKQNFEANADLNIEISKLLHKDQKVGQLTEEKIQESSTVGSADDCHADQGSHMMTSEGARIQIQDFGANIDFENKSSKLVHDVNQVLQLQPEATVESGTFSSSDIHTNDRESKETAENVAVQEQGIDANCNQESHKTMETGAQQNQEFKADQGKEKERTGNLHNEKDVVQLKPNTMRESGAVSSADHSDERESCKKTESGTQSKQDFVADPDLEKETPQHLHNEQQTVCLIPETELASSNPDFDHGSSKLLEALESDLEKEVAIHQEKKPVSTIAKSAGVNIVDPRDTCGHENPIHQKSNMENGPLQKNMAFGGNLPLKNIIFKNLMEEEVWLTPKTTLEAITPRAPMTPRAVEPSKPLQVTDEVRILESVDHGSDNQDFDEKSTSRPQQNEQDIHCPQQVTSDRTQLESGGDVMSSTMESGPAKELRFEPNHNLRNIIYKNLQKEEEIWLTPRTAADPCHNYQHDNGSSSAQTCTSTAEAEKKVDSDEGNHHPEENETSDSKTLDYHEKVVDDENGNSTATDTIKVVDFDEGNHHPEGNFQG